MAGSPTPSKSDDVSCERVARTCPCGKAFETVAIMRNGKPVTNGSRFCPDCLDERDKPYTPQQADRAGRIKDILGQVGVNVHKHGDCTLDNWEGVASNRPITAANDFVRDVIAAGRSQGVRGLYLCGETGTGKTHLATGILRNLLLSDRIDPSRVVFDRAARLITEIQDTYGTGGTEKVLAKRENAVVWVLDDLGAEKATEDVLRILVDLMSAREGHANVITSNYEPGQIGERWQGSFGWNRLASRLGTENFLAVRVKGADRRLQAPKSPA